jgi:hypothetical protein
MNVLRTTLKVGAAVLLLTCVPLALFPEAVVEGVLDQAPIADDAWIRLFGVGGIALALFHVLVAQRITDVWWWSWAFALFDAGAATVSVLNAAFGVPEGSATWPWWLMGGGSIAFAALYLIGLALAGQEKPFV